MSTSGGTRSSSSKKSTAPSSDSSERFISRKEVSAWTADSAPGVPKIGVHYGTPEKLASLRRTGFEESRGDGLHSYGAGLYMYDSRYGDVNYTPGAPHVDIAIRMLNPLFTDPTHEAEHTTSYARRRGYDGIVSMMPGRPETAIIVAFKPGTARVITSGTRKAAATPGKPTSATDKSATEKPARQAPKSRATTKTTKTTKKTEGKGIKQTTPRPRATPSPEAKARAANTRLRQKWNTQVETFKEPATMGNPSSAQTRAAREAYDTAAQLELAARRFNGPGNAEFDALVARFTAARTAYNAAVRAAAKASGAPASGAPARSRKKK